MIQRQLKLKLTRKQEKQLETWLPILTSIWNWGLRKIELNAVNKIYFSKFDFCNLLSGSNKKLNIPSHVIQGILSIVHLSWSRCFKKLAKKPKLKGSKNKLNWVPFPDPIISYLITKNRITLPILGSIRYHKQEIPEGKIKCSSIVKRASGWYLCVVIDARTKEINKVSHNQIGIDLGYKTLATLSNGEKIEHPRELQKKINRIGQAQRGYRYKLVGKLHEHVANQKKDRNHKLSRKLVAENDLIAVSHDNILGLARTVLSSAVFSANHGQLRDMLKYKSTNSGTTTYTEVTSRNSTRTCNCCGALTGPTGRAGLKVRSWVCASCGAHLDRDVNAAINTLKAALGSNVESAVKAGQESKGN